jgi:archaellum component FlaC
VLDRAFAGLEKLEKELKSVDPTTPEGGKRMAEIVRQLNRIDEMISMVNQMRKDRHDANMAVIGNI